MFGKHCELLNSLIFMMFLRVDVHGKENSGLVEKVEII